MKKLFLILSLSIIVFSCSKEEEKPEPVVLTQQEHENNDTTQTQYDTIIPYSVSNCCDTNITMTGTLDPSISFIASVITPDGDGYNDCFYIGYSGSPTQQLVLTLQDSLGTIAHEDSIYNSLDFCGISYIPGTGSLPEGMYDAVLYSATGTAEFKLCIVINQCLPCFNSCKRIDMWDPQFQ